MKIFFKIAFVLTVFNLLVILLFWLRFSAPVLEAAASFFPGSETHGAFLAAQANHYALLQLYLVIFSLILAIAAFWGYNEIKRAAEASVAKAIKESMPEMMQKHLISFGRDEIAKMLLEMEIKNSSLEGAKNGFDHNITKLIEGLED